MRKLLIFALCCVTAFSVFAYGCSKPAPEPEPEPPVVVEPEPEPEPEPEVRDPSKFWPLTGFPTSNDTEAFIRPLSIKIENSDGARPQMGLEHADVIYETVVEGGITRFNCIFQSDIPEEVGPVRSARLSDLWIVPQYHALFFYSGANAQVTPRIMGSEIPNMYHSYAAPLYHRVSNREAPHNLFLSPQGAYEYATEKLGYDIVDDFPGLQFSDGITEATGGTPAVEISSPLSNAANPEWKYDEATGRYQRWFANSPSMLVSGEQMSAKNVVVLWAEYISQKDIPAVSQTWDTVLGGSGKVSVFKDGKRYDGNWGANQWIPPQLTYDDGTPLLLEPGNTWFEVAMLDTEITVE